MPVLRMKGVKVASLDEFREHFDFDNAKDYLRQGRLSRWVRDLGENELADELDELNVADYGDKTLLDNFVGIFGLAPESVRLAEKAAPAPEEDTPEEDAPPGFSRQVTDIRKKLEDPDFSGRIAAPREPQLVKELLELLHEYFGQWSAALRKARGRALSGNRWELGLTNIAGYMPFMRCADLLNRLTSTSEKKKDKNLRMLFDLPERMEWTSISRPEQLEKTKVIAAYGVCFVEFEYRTQKTKSRQSLRE